jgi:glycosyltransferase involved in cell wall biosynthesis
VRLTFDARVWKTGIGTYTMNLLAALRRIDHEIRIRAIVRKEAREAVSGLCDETRVVDAPIYTLEEQLRIPAAARGCNLFHAPHYNVPVLYRGPMVATIHDVTHLTDPAFRRTAGAWLYAQPMLRIAARKPSQVITDSAYSRGQIVERLGVKPGKVSVIYPGVSPQFHPFERSGAVRRVKAELAIDQPYLLFVGNLKPNKNVKTLVRAFARLSLQRHFKHCLVLIGDDEKYRPRVLEECRALGVEQAVRHVPWVSQELLPQVYAAADLLVMPSTNEGFGFPVLEALACGTPVACSHAASLPEVGGEAAVYFDPSNAEDMAGAIERVLDTPSLQEELREKGLKRVRKFSWEECARRHVEVYRKILEQ